MPYRNYPLATPEGKYIPIDVLEPVEALDPIPLTTSAMGAAIALPEYEKRILKLYSDAVCVIGYNIDPVNGTTEKGVYILHAGEHDLVFPIGGYISAITYTGTATLYVSLLNRWESMRKDYQTTTEE